MLKQAHTPTFPLSKGVLWNKAIARLFLLFFFFSKLKPDFLGVPQHSLNHTWAFSAALRASKPLQWQEGHRGHRWGLEAGRAQTYICDSHTHPNFVGSPGQHDKQPDLLHRAVSEFIPGWKLLLSEKKPPPWHRHPPPWAPPRLPPSQALCPTWTEIKIKIKT